MCVGGGGKKAKQPGNSAPSSALPGSLSSPRGKQTQPHAQAATPQINEPGSTKDRAILGRTQSRETSAAPCLLRPGPDPCKQSESSSPRTKRQVLAELSASSTACQLRPTCERASERLLALPPANEPLAATPGTNKGERGGGGVCARVMRGRDRAAAAGAIGSPLRSPVAPLSPGVRGSDFATY